MHLVAPLTAHAAPVTHRPVAAHWSQIAEDYGSVRIFPAVDDEEDLAACSRQFRLRRAALAAILTTALATGCAAGVDAVASPFPSAVAPSVDEDEPEDDGSATARGGVMLGDDDDTGGEPPVAGNDADDGADDTTTTGGTGTTGTTGDAGTSTGDDAQPTTGDGPAVPGEQPAAGYWSPCAHHHDCAGDDAELALYGDGDVGCLALWDDGEGSNLLGSLIEGEAPWTGYCAAPCETAADCPPPPNSDAIVRCEDTGAHTVKYCALLVPPCSQGPTCPIGMECAKVHMSNFDAAYCF